MFHLLHILFGEILSGLFERRSALGKASIGIVLGALSSLGFGILGYFFLSQANPAEGDLVAVEGIVSEAADEKSGRWDHALVVSLRGTDVRMRSDAPYPGRFRHGSGTPQRLRRGELVTFLLYRSELEREPRKNRIHGYEWREFVGLGGGGAVHLTPDDHESWHNANRALGRVAFPVLSAVGLFVFIKSCLERKRLLAGRGRERAKRSR